MPPSQLVRFASSTSLRNNSCDIFPDYHTPVRGHLISNVRVDVKRKDRLSKLLNGSMTLFSPYGVDDWTVGAK